MGLEASPTVTRVLFDFNNLAFRCVHIGLDKGGRSTDEAWSLISYAIFNQIVNFLDDSMEFMDVGDRLEVVLALDSTAGYWRRDIYPPYKADRAKKRSQSDIDWDRAYAEFEKLTAAISEFTPWRVLKVDKCEADDIIYTLTVMDDKPSIIYSSDSDYLQLVSDNVVVYQPHRALYAEFPMMCKFSGSEVICRDTEDFLKYAILTGQGGKDNVYNVKTPADWQADDTHKRKPGFGIKAAQTYVGASDMLKMLECDGLLSNYERNRTLIDMRCLSAELQAEICKAYNAAPKRSVDMYGFLNVYNWPSMLSSPGEIQHRLMVFDSGKEPVSENKVPEPVSPVVMGFTID
jgi:hypothetical protein